MQGNCERPRGMEVEFKPHVERKGKSAFGIARHGKKSGPEWSGAEKCSGCVRCRLGPKVKL